MTNQQVLEKAIQKAIDGGYHELDYNARNYYTTSNHWSTLVYSHDFAKALWGEERTHTINRAFDKVDEPGWQRHLQQMVIAEDPIKYLGENI